MTTRKEEERGEGGERKGMLCYIRYQVILTIYDFTSAREKGKKKRDPDEPLHMTNR